MNTHKPHAKSDRTNVKPMMLRVAVHGISLSSKGRLKLRIPCRLSSYRASSSWNWNENRSSGEKRSENVVATAPLSVDAQGQVQKQVLDKCAALHASIMPLNEKLRGPLAKHSDKGTSLPFVFLVGNHSSGKSSFVNYVMGRTIQTAGVAPTDDCFTVIAPGPKDTDQDGPALVGDPDMGFGNLRQFGPTLIHHTQLKVRKDIATSNFMLVDSPGMIDSPVSSQEMDRGYDFKGVVKWFAERADVVLLFFDPDKPGTTGETLHVLLHSLGGMDHKLLIVLNKADQFKKVRSSWKVICCNTEFSASMYTCLTIILTSNR
jgi:GTP-binding protein EngB required for normal cell division